MSRNEVAVWDADLARQQAQAELREKVVPKKVHEANKIGGAPIQMSEESRAKMALAMQKQLEKFAQIADERRRRDPTFKPDAIDLDRSKMRKFNKYVDYYEVLGITDRFCGPSGLKDAYKKKSLALHPDKQRNSSEEEKIKNEEEFHAVQKAYDILTEPATRQAYDKARAKVEAEYEAGVVSVDDETTKPPPSCVDVLVPLEELFSGCRKVVRYTRMMFEGTKWEKKTDDTYKLEIRPGELEGATYWFKNQGDVTTAGKADLVFVIQQEPHPTWERVGVDLWHTLPPEHPPLDVGSTFYFTLALPSLEGSEKKWVGTKLTTIAIQKSAVACGDCLAARLGYDRSGYAEAVVKGRGMPLFAREENARRGTGEVEEREQAVGPQKAPKVAPAVDASKLRRGDLIVKVPLQLRGWQACSASSASSASSLPHTLRLAPGVQVFLPPIGLVTTGKGGVAPLQPLASLLTHILLPAVVTRITRRVLDELRVAKEEEDAALLVRDEGTEAAETGKAPSAEAVDVTDQLSGDAAYAHPDIARAVAAGADPSVAAAAHAETKKRRAEARTRAMEARARAAEVARTLASAPAPMSSTPGSAAASAAPTQEAAAAAPAAEDSSVSSWFGSLITAWTPESAAAPAAAEEPAAAAPAAEQAAAPALADVGAEANESASVPAAAATVTTLSYDVLCELQAECLADDVPIDLEEMQQWTEDMVRAYFESGGAEKPTPAQLEAANQPTGVPAAPTASVASVPGGIPGGIPATIPRLAVQAVAPTPEEALASALRAARARRHLRGVCLRVGGTAPSDPTPAAQSVMALISSALPQLEWRTIHMVHGLEFPLLPDEESAVEGAAVLLLEAASDGGAQSGGGGQLVFDPKAGKLVPVQPKAPFFEPPSDGTRPRDETEEEEVVAGKESDVVRTRGETEYLTCGRGLARELLDEDVAASAYRCHAAGGVLLAMDHMCALLGQTTRPITPKQKKRAAAASLAAAYGDAAGPATEPTPGHAGGVVGEKPRQLGDWPMLMPYAVGLAPPAAPKADPCAMSWRRLAGTAKDVPDCVHGFSACGLPPGCAVAALTERGCKLRAALGSAQPRQFAAAAMRDRLSALAAVRQKRKVEQECEKRLADLARAHAQAGEAFPALVRPNGPFRDFHGVLRGHCPRCNGCPGFDLPRCPQEPNLLILCVHCGCDASAHEAMRTEAEKAKESEDDVLKGFKYD